MLVVDTNVISEALKPEPNAKVRAWLEAQSAASVFTTAISHAEFLNGVALLPKGRRQSALLTAAALMFEEDFRGRVLPFDSGAATIYAALRRPAGKTVSQFLSLTRRLQLSHNRAAVAWQPATSVILPAAALRS
jgi:predicted nucleic acid-binding protein